MIHTALPLTIGRVGSLLVNVEADRRMKRISAEFKRRMVLPVYQYWPIFVVRSMKYLDFMLMVDLLSRYYPKYHSNDILVLADDVWKWINNELPEDSSTLIYLKKYFSSPADAIKVILKELQLRVGPYINLN